jgi:hypothetical protein
MLKIGWLNSNLCFRRFDIRLPKQPHFRSSNKYNIKSSKSTSIPCLSIHLLSSHSNSHPLQVDPSPIFPSPSPCLPKPAHMNPSSPGIAQEVNSKKPRISRLPKRQHWFTSHQQKKLTPKTVQVKLIKYPWTKVLNNKSFKKSGDCDYLDELTKFRSTSGYSNAHTTCTGKFNTMKVTLKLTGKAFSYFETKRGSIILEVFSLYLETNLINPKGREKAKKSYSRRISKLIEFILIILRIKFNNFHRYPSRLHL